MRETAATETREVPMTTKTTHHETLYHQACQAGETAADAHTPTPMFVVQRENPFDDTSQVVRNYGAVTGGVCGFAWVTVTPGTSSFARYLKTRGARKGYYGGVEKRVHGYGQSMEKKEAYAQAFAAVLREAGVNAYAESRMD
jgi:hypothetical protein